MCVRVSFLFFYILVQEALDAFLGCFFEFLRIEFEACYLGECR